MTKTALVKCSLEFQYWYLVLNWVLKFENWDFVTPFKITSVFDVSG